MEQVEWTEYGRSIDLHPVAISPTLSTAKRAGQESKTRGELFVFELSLCLASESRDVFGKVIDSEMVYGNAYLGWELHERELLRLSSDLHHCCGGGEVL